MAKEYARSRRLGNEIRRILNEVVRRELNDPRLRSLTITETEVSGDLAHAKVYFSLLDPEADPGPARAALEKAAGFLRSQLGRGLKARHVPELQFEHDASLAEGARMTSLIDDAVARDKRRHRDD